jgi:outer membrane lipoprotein-sorting protein
VNLVPKQPNGPFTRAKVWVDAANDLIRQFEIVDMNGLTRVVTITSIQPNATVASSAFQFVAPKNARVLDSASY